MKVIATWRWVGVEPGEEATIALSVTWPFSTPLSSDAAPTSSYPGMSAQISNSCRENLIGSVWVRLANPYDQGIEVL